MVCRYGRSRTRSRTVPISSGASFIGRHFALVTLLVLSSKLVVLLTFLLGESLELLRDDLGNVAESCVGIGLLYSRTMHVGVDEERGLIALGGVRILLLLLLPFAVIVAIVTGGDVILHLSLVPLLVLGSEIFPLLLLVLGESLELLRQNFGDVTEFGIWVLSLDSLAIGAAVQVKTTSIWKISTSVGTGKRTQTNG